MSDETRHGVLRLPATILAAIGARDAAPGFIAGLGSRAFVVADPFLADSPFFLRLMTQLDERGIAVFVHSAVEPELPIGSLDAAADAARAFDPDVIVGYGGGSALDAAKLVALLLAHGGPLSRYYGENLVPSAVLPVVAMPTTAGTGSEVTPVAVVADPDRALKVGISSPHLIPTIAIVDPELSMTAPARVAAYAGADALVHAIESFTAGPRGLDLTATLPVSTGSNVLSAPYSLEAIRLITRSLRGAVLDPEDRDARIDMAYGSLAAGIAFGSTGCHLSHALQYPIGAATHTPHGLGTGMMLPFVLRACLPAITGRLAQIAAVIGLPAASVEDAAEAVIDFVDTLFADIGLPRSLRDMGVEHDDLADLAKLAAGLGRLTATAPIPVDETVLLAILESAWRGDEAA